MIELVILYNLIWLVSLIVNFAIIYTLINKYDVSKKGKTILILFNIYHKAFDVFDIIYNYHLSLLFLQFPKKFNETISDRLRRYHKQTVYFDHRMPLDFYRFAVSLPFVKIVNYFDRGHI